MCLADETHYEGPPKHITGTLQAHYGSSKPDSGTLQTRYGYLQTRSRYL